jgi:hypothetical protein
MNTVYKEEAPADWLGMKCCRQFTVNPSQTQRRHRMREIAYEMPDPDSSGDGRAGDGPFGDALDTDYPDFQRASASCEGIIGG